MSKSTSKKNIKGLIQPRPARRLSPKRKFGTLATQLVPFLRVIHWWMAIHIRPSWDKVPALANTLWYPNLISLSEFFAREEDGVKCPWSAKDVAAPDFSHNTINKILTIDADNNLYCLICTKHDINIIHIHVCTLILIEHTHRPYLYGLYIPIKNCAAIF